MPLFSPELLIPCCLGAKGVAALDGLASHGCCLDGRAAGEQSGVLSSPPS